MEPEELAFRAGDDIHVEDASNADWWWGSRGGRVGPRGWFPAAFVRLKLSPAEAQPPLAGTSARSSVVKELLSTERDFVKTLTDIQHGFIFECRRRGDMFTSEQVNTVFSNLEQILQFQTSFLRDLESVIVEQNYHLSCVGEVFLKHRDGFHVFSEYCNSHPLATATLQDLQQREEVRKFLEACRFVRGMPPLPLAGYLLTPVQRICKYPLQLAELLKYTSTSHEDYMNLRRALTAMGAVALHINERKRRMESLEKLHAWQLKLDGWEVR